MTLAASILFSTSTAAQVQIEIVDEGNSPSIYVEPDGTVHVVYFRNYDYETKLVYATRKITGDWKYRTLGMAAYCYDLDMTLDNAGNVHIVMSDERWDISPKSRLFHGILTKDGSWSRKIIAVAGTRFYSLSLKCSSTNDLYLTFLEYDQPARWKEMHRTGGTWSKPQEFGRMGYNCMDMSLDKEDNMHVSLYNLLFAPLIYLNKPVGEEWSEPETIDPKWNAGQLEGLVTSISLDSENNPHVSYVGGENYDHKQHTRYAWKEDGKWHNMMVDRGQFQSGGNKIVIDPDDVAHIAYAYYKEDIYDPKDVRYASNITGTWVKQTIGKNVNAINVDMGIDQGNNVHVVYGGYSASYTEQIYYNNLKISRYFDVSPDTLDFRGVAPGENKTLVLTLTNTLPVDIVIDSVVIGDKRIDFDRTSFTVAANSVEYVNVTLDHTAAFWEDCDLTIWYEGFFVAVPVLATNYQPDLEVDPDPIDFGAVLLGTTATKTVTLSNNGIMDLNIYSISVKYELFPGYVIPTDFSLSGHNCSILPDNATCQVQISFKPMKTGPQRSYLVINSNDPSSPVTKIDISGKTAHPQILSSHYDVDFGYCAVGNSVSRDIIITNAGEVNLGISNIAISGTQSARFAMSNNCSELEPGDSCKITVTMTPDEPADYAADLTITSNSFYSGTLNISLHGTSLVRKLEILPSEISFGEVELGTSSGKQIQINNTGSGSITINSLQIVGDDPDEFYQNIECQIIEEGQTCTDSVWYIPSFEGIKSAVLQVSSNDPFHPEQTVTLSGGTGPALPLSVSIEAEPPSGAAPLYIYLRAVITGGQGPYWYRWNIENIGTYTDVKAPQILFAEAGIYTVILKITDINDNSASDTLDVIITSEGIPIASATADPIRGEIPLEVQFDAMVSGGDPPLKYFWNFRDGGTSEILNPVHTFSNAGTYWVKFTVTDDNYDSYTDSVLITAKWNTGFSGQIWDNEGIQPVNEAVVRFIQRPNTLNIWTDILEGTNEYSFLNLPPAEYTVLAIPDTTEYPEFLPTYLGHELLRNDAFWVNMTGHITGQDIRLIEKPFQGTGMGNFYGFVSIAIDPDKSSPGTNEITLPKGNDLSGIYIYIKDAVTGDLIAWDVTDEYGYFSLEGLEDGSYVVVVDYEGLPMDPSNKALVISDELKSAELRILIYDDRISVVNIATGLTESLSSGIKVYPLPANEILFLDIPADQFNTLKMQCSIFDMSGKVISRNLEALAEGGTISVDISALPEGVYLLQLNTNRIKLTYKVIKIR